MGRPRPSAKIYDNWIFKSFENIDRESVSSLKCIYGRVYIEVSFSASFDLTGNRNADFQLTWRKAEKTRNETSEEPGLFQAGSSRLESVSTSGCLSERRLQLRILFYFRNFDC